MMPTARSSLPSPSKSAGMAKVMSSATALPICTGAANVPSPRPAMYRSGMSVASVTSAMRSSFPSWLKSATASTLPRTPVDAGAAKLPSPFPSATTIVDVAPAGALDDTRSILPSPLKSPASVRPESDSRRTDIDARGRAVCAAMGRSPSPTINDRVTATPNADTRARLIDVLSESIKRSRAVACCVPGRLWDFGRYNAFNMKSVAEAAPKTFSERSTSFTTISGRKIERVYVPRDIEHLDYSRDIADPGSFPYTRGIHETGYRGKLWTMRQFAGFGTPEETNERYKTLLRAGGTGLSVAFDLPTLMGRDPDHELSLGETGKCGVNVTSLADMETLFDGIALGDITTSMTINSPAAMIFAMYLVVAEKQGASWQTLSGTIQNDILKEFIAQKEYIFPPRPSMRLITDVFRFCAKEVPRWNTISVSGYHIREAGATALQELAFTLRDGLEYVQWGVDAGLDVDEFVPRISFFFNAHSDFFEEIAKYRAARALWARAMRDRFGAKDERSWKLRFHTQTAGVSLTAQQPYNNVVRTALQALSAVLGGTNSLHTNSL